MRLVLASASPRRAELLRAAGFDIEVLPVNVEERVVPGETPEAYVRRLAREKAIRGLEMMTGSAGPGAGRGSRSPAEGVHSPAEAVLDGPAKAGHYVLLGADTAVVLDGTVLGKPADDEEAASMLRRLSGKTHEVLTGVCLRTIDWEKSLVESTAVEFATLTAAEIRWHVESGEGRDKAGAYAIQGLASRFIPRISGSYSNVVGLPVAAVQALVAEIASRPWPGYPKR
jgi:septum formation protein